MKMTQLDIKKFKKYVSHWVEFFGLYGWEINIRIQDEDDEDDNMATTYFNIMNRRADIELSNEWKNQEIIDKELYKTAFHEVLEVLFSKIRIIAGARFISDSEIDEEIHNLIRTFEKVICDKKEI